MNTSNNDYLALTDNDGMIEFYVTVLGMVAKTFGKGRCAQKSGTQKIILYDQYGQEFESKANKPLPASPAGFIYILSYA